MPYYDKTMDGHTYYCPNHKQWYFRPNIAISCLVIHSKGDCCHMGEQVVEPPVFVETLASEEKEIERR